MIINLNPAWRIKVEPGQWVVQNMPPVQDASKGRKRETWANKAYCRTLDSAIVRCARLQIEVLEGTYGAEALSPLVASLERIESEVRRALYPLESDAEAS